MKSALIIATDEWRYWFRSKLGMSSALLAFFLICTSILATVSQVKSEKEARQSLQHTAEHTFRDQPARHPHRMVHYGHYVFRTPTPLAVLDPGIDPYTGTVMFLEGHRQNSPTFSPKYDSAQAGPFARLTPALSYQLLVPLLLIIMGFGAVSREREAATDRQLVTSGVSPATIWFGKSLALLGAASLILIPMIIGVALSDSTPSVGLGFSALYAAYLFAWVMIIVAASTWSSKSSSSLMILITVWLCICVLAPRLLAGAASANIASPSKIEADMGVIVAIRKVGDGHNASDPAFNRLRAKLLAQYNVERVEDLPINFRGVVSEAAETDLTKILNEYAEKSMAKQLEQTAFVKSLQLVSPFVALQSASMIAAGTDMRSHHRFLRQAEATRFEFVQGLNKAHADEMSYTDDINRNKSSEAYDRTRVNPENWRVLNDFKFEAYPPSNRIALIKSSLLALLVWSILAALLGYIGSRRLPEVGNG